MLDFVLEQAWTVITFATLKKCLPVEMYIKKCCQMIANANQAKVTENSIE